MPNISEKTSPATGLGPRTLIAINVFHTPRMLEILYGQSTSVQNARVTVQHHYSKSALSGHIDLITTQYCFRDGGVGQVELARLTYVRRTRLTQLMNLLNLAPEMQDALQMLPPVAEGPDVVIERQWREIV